MKAIVTIVLLFALTGCDSLRKDVYLAGQQFYLGGHKVVSRERGGFTAQCPESWEFYVGTDLDPGVSSKDQFKIGVTSYDKSPILQCNVMQQSVNWRDDLERISPRFDYLSSKNHRIVLREDISSFRGYAGHGRRWVKTGYFSEDEEIVVLYPAGELSGSRLVISHIGTPNATAWQEFDEIVRTLRRIQKNKDPR